jgi:hypothetical protein
MPHSSAIIQDIETLCKAGLGSIAYFYFDFRDLDKQNRRNLLSSLLVQLSARSSPRCDILHRLYLDHDHGTKMPTEAVLTQCLKDMLAIPISPQFTLSWTRLTSVRTHTASHRLVHRFSFSSSSSSNSSYHISTSASPAAPSSIFGPLLDHWHSLTVCRFMTKADKRRTLSITSNLWYTLSPWRL